MNEQEIFKRLSEGTLTRDAAIAELVKLGADPDDAAEMVAQHFGADDVHDEGEGEVAE